MQALGIVMGTTFVMTLASCGPHLCTLIGCQGLLVELTGSVPDTVTVAVSSPGGGTQSKTCVRLNGGRPALSFPDFTPDVVTIRVTTQSISLAVTVEPRYEISYPNGRDCGPECRSARVVVEL